MSKDEIPDNAQIGRTLARSFNRDPAANAGTVGRCKDCRHWAPPYQFAGPFNVCSRVERRHDPAAHEARLAHPEPDDAVFQTGPEFGCTLFEAKVT